VNDLVAFLTARLDEDEAAAKAAYCYGPSSMQPTAPPAGSWWEPAEIMGKLGVGTFNDAQHIARHDPARVLREVEAKRAILAQWEHSPPGSPVLTFALYNLAAVYGDHPDYRQEWKP
jgi:Family of unknown function (DUF6221)